MAKYSKKSKGTSALVVSIMALFLALAVAFCVVATTSNNFTDWSFLPWVNSQEEIPPADDDGASTLPDEVIPGNPDNPSFKY